MTRFETQKAASKKPSAFFADAPTPSENRAYLGKINF
jgi:hypothetical protein